MTLKNITKSHAQKHYPGLTIYFAALKRRTSLATYFELLKIRSNCSRNSLISKILRENSFVRELGEGMRRIFSLLESQEMESPILNNAENYFSITFKNKSIYSAKEESYLNIFNKFELTANQKRIVILGIKKDEISPQDIYKAMNTNDRDTYDREVTGLRRHGILVQTRTNPSATILAKKLKITKQAIGRFKIEMPK